MIANIPDAPPLPGYRHLYSGKVRDLYEPVDGAPHLLVVASDRISAYDHVLASTIPDKGKVLTAMSTWWARCQPVWYGTSQKRARACWRT